MTTAAGGGGSPLVFPPSTTCLWDDQRTGDPIEICVDGRCWVCVRLSQSVLQLAVRAGQHANSSLLCLLLGSGSISEKGGVVVNVDRFDLGRDVGYCLQPTALIPGDVIIYCTVGSWKSTSVPKPLAEQELLRKLEASAVPAPALLHLQLHISPSHLPHPKPLASLTCSCVYPRSCTLTPVTTLPIFPTALARNLAGPLSLSVLQASVKWGYLTMEVTRKLVVLLQSDPKSESVPLVGVWVSGISSCTHPAVWATLLHYKHSKQLTRKVEKSSALCLVYCTGSQPQLFQFNQDIEDQFTLSTAELKVEMCSMSPPTVFELVPLHSPTLSKEHVLPHPHLCGTAHRRTAPQPSPLPALTKISQLSAISFMEKSLHSSFGLCPSSDRSSGTNHATPNDPQRLMVFPEKIQVEPPVLQSSDQQSQHFQKHCSPYRTPTMTEKATNTGISLLLLHCPKTNDGGSGQDGGFTMATENSTASSVTGMEQSMSTGEVSLKTETSVLGTSSINLDLCSFAPSSLQNKSVESVSTPTAGEDSSMLNSKLFYQNMLVRMLRNTPCVVIDARALSAPHSCVTTQESVQELLQTPVEENQPQSVCHGNQGQSEYKVGPEVSVFPIPQITSVTTCSEATLDETAQAADLITMKYVDHHTASQQSLESDRSLQRLQLLSSHPDNHLVLDLGRLRSLPKLL